MTWPNMQAMLTGPLLHGTSLPCPSCIALPPHRGRRPLTCIAVRASEASLGRLPLLPAHAAPLHAHLSHITWSHFHTVTGTQSRVPVTSNHGPIPTRSPPSLSDLVDSQIPSVFLPPNPNSTPSPGAGVRVHHRHARPAERRPAGGGGAGAAGGLVRGGRGGQLEPPADLPHPLCAAQPGERPAGRHGAQASHSGGAATLYFLQHALVLDAPLIGLTLILSLPSCSCPSC